MVAIDRYHWRGRTRRVNIAHAPCPWRSRSASCHTATTPIPSQSSAAGTDPSRLHTWRQPAAHGSQVHRSGDDLAVVRNAQRFRVDLHGGPVLAARGGYWQQLPQARLALGCQAVRLLAQRSSNAMHLRLRASRRVCPTADSQNGSSAVARSTVQNSLAARRAPHPRAAAGAPALAGSG